MTNINVPPNLFEFVEDVTQQTHGITYNLFKTNDYNHKLLMFKKDKFILSPFEFAYYIYDVSFSKAIEDYKRSFDVTYNYGGWDNVKSNKLLYKFARIICYRFLYDTRELLSESDIDYIENGNTLVSFMYASIKYKLETITHSNKAYIMQLSRNEKLIYDLFDEMKVNESNGVSSHNDYLRYKLQLAKVIDIKQTSITICKTVTNTYALTKPNCSRLLELLSKVIESRKTTNDVSTFKLMRRLRFGNVITQREANMIDRYIVTKANNNIQITGLEFKMSTRMIENLIEYDLFMLKTFYCYIYLCKNFQTQIKKLKQQQ